MKPRRQSKLNVGDGQSTQRQREKTKKGGDLQSDLKKMIELHIHYRQLKNLYGTINVKL